MKTVNELMFGEIRNTRQETENVLFIDTIADELKKPENYRMRDAIHNLQIRRIKNIGERGSAELLGALAIFLTQIPEKQVEAVARARRDRDSDW